MKRVTPLQRFTCGAAIWVFVMSLGSFSNACPTCALVGDGFTLPHPRALQIATAINSARQSNIIESAESAANRMPIEVELERFARRAFAASLSKKESRQLDILLIDEGALFRVELASGSLRIVQLTGSQHRAADRRLVTGRPVISFIARAELTLEEALTQKLALLEDARQAPNRPRSSK